MFKLTVILCHLSACLILLIPLQAQAQSPREICAAALYEATFAGDDVEKTKALDLFVSNGCDNDLRLSLGSSGIPKRGATSAMALMALAYQSTRALKRASTPVACNCGTWVGQSKPPSGTVFLPQGDRLYKFQLVPQEGDGHGAWFLPGSKEFQGQHFPFDLPKGGANGLKR